MEETLLLTDKHILLIDDDIHTEYLKDNFCGKVFVGDDIKNFINNGDSIIYLCGDVEKIYNTIENAKNTKNIIFVINDYSYNFPNEIICNFVDIDQVPINIHGCGVFFRKLFSEDDYFRVISENHKFTSLTESNKPSNAFRKGIYLTKVEEEKNEIKFKLLRCSSNLNGPSDNFRDVDNKIVDCVNKYAKMFFGDCAELNHVLAQIYENKIINMDNKTVERKAKIKEHSDKTKDMPANGLIAFTTFYDSYVGGEFNIKNIKRSVDDPYDFCFNKTSVLTKLRFRLKKIDKHPTLVKNFDIILYPNSVFIISLSTNRLYTHEIVPSGLPIDKLPTRMGYVIRCSKTDAIYKNGKTYMKYADDDCLQQLQEPDEQGIKKLKDLYFKENATDDIVNYDKFYFSLNKGDYEKPIR